MKTHSGPCVKCGHDNVNSKGICQQIIGRECSDPYGEECECECVFPKGQSEERIPEFLVRVEYEIPPARGISSMHFEDLDKESDEMYKQACIFFNPTAIIRSVVRRVRPIPDLGKGGCS